MKKHHLFQRFLTLVLVILLAGTTSGCLSHLVDGWPATHDNQTETTRRRPSRPQSGSGQKDTQIHHEPTLLDPTSSQSQATAQATEAPEAVLYPEDLASFDRLVEQLIRSGLEAGEQAINLDQVCQRHLITEDVFDEAIDRIFSIYTAYFRATPRLFYLDGSFTYLYSFTGDDPPLLHNLSLEPNVWPSFEDWSDEQLWAISDQVDAEVKDWVRSIRQTSSNPADQLQELHDQMVRSIAYDERQRESTNHAASALLDQVALCQGYAQLFQLVSQALGFETSLIIGETDGIGHAWNQVILDGRSYHVDVTHDDPLPDGGPDGPVRHVHLLRSDEVMRETHDWDSLAYPACSQDGAFYYRTQGLVARTELELAQLLARFLGEQHWPVRDTLFFELLWDGVYPIDEVALDDMLETALLPWLSGTVLYYRIEQTKRVLLISLSDTP